MGRKSRSHYRRIVSLPYYFVAYGCSHNRPLGDWPVGNRLAIDQTSIVYLTFVSPSATREKRSITLRKARNVL